MSSDLNGAPAPPSNQSASEPGEFAFLWNALPEAGRVDLLEMLNRNSEKAVACFLQNHEDRLAQWRTWERAIVDRIPKYADDQPRWSVLSWLDKLGGIADAVVQAVREEDVDQAAAAAIAFAVVMGKIEDTEPATSDFKGRDRWNEVRK